MTAYRAVIEERGFGRAASRLGLSAASVSRLVAELEAHLDVRLLHRTTRTLRSTDEGRTYYERCVRILDEIDEAEALAREAHAVPSGVLRVTASPALGATVIAPLLPSFHARHPRVRVDLFLEDRVVDVIREQYDVALRFLIERPDSSLVCRKVATIPNRFVASPAYVAVHGAPERPAELSRHAVIVWSRRSLPESLVVVGPDGRHVVAVDGPVRTDSSAVQRALALAGVGITELPDYVVRHDLASGALVQVLPDHATPALELFVVLPPGATLAARVRAFVDHVADGLRPDGEPDPGSHPSRRHHSERTPGD